MKRSQLFGIACVSVALVSCDEGNFPRNSCSNATTTHCVKVRGGDEAALQEAVNSAEPSTTIVLGKGVFELDNQVTIRQSGIHLIGQGIGETTLSFATATTQINGVDAVGDDFLIQDLTVQDAPKDGIRVESSIGVVFRRIRAAWTEPFQTSNGAYGIYPVRCQNVLVEDSEAESASDAGLYVGQCQHVIVRRNHVMWNVAGLEIENTAYADVYENVAEENTAGIVVFDMQENPIIGRDVRMHDNIIRNNNTMNFAKAGTTVSIIPRGIGTFALASRRVEITNNTYEDNGTTDIAILSGLVLDGDLTKWTHDTSTLIGDWADLGLLTPEGSSGQVMNYRSENILIAGNSHTGGGLDIGSGDPKGFGLLLIGAFYPNPVPNVLYDAIEESTFDASNLAANSNDNHICIGDASGVSFASLDLESQEATNGQSPILKLQDGPYGPFGCTALLGSPIAPVVLDSAGP